MVVVVQFLIRDYIAKLINNCNIDKIIIEFNYMQKTFS